MARSNTLKYRRPSPFSQKGGSTDSIGSVGSLDQSEVDKDGDGINVVVRVRPLNTKEMKSREQSVLSFPGNGQVLLQGLNVISSHNGPKSKLFSFNVVFEPQASQFDVFNFCGIKRLIGMAVEGFNTTCFCYGQTGSGKTHTLTGPPGMFLKKKVDPLSPNHGLVYRSFLFLFQQLRNKTDVHFILKASFLEIYNEKVIDLLNTGSTQKPLSVRWSKKSQGFYVENLFTVDCEELDDLQAVLEEGMRNRAVSSHQMNENSGRSHTILTVHIISEQEMTDSEVFITKHGKINFVDLAGSEMTKKTNSSGKTLKEANNINKSLMVLGYCISLLSDTRKRNNHIPYRDSKLTKLLADSLAGSGITLMIACTSPAQSNVCETLNTLRYAARAKRIRTKPIIVMDPRESLIVALKREVEALQNENKSLREVLYLNKRYVENMKKSSEISEILKNRSTFNIEKLFQMGHTELVEMIKYYAVENEALRKENSDLFRSKDLMLRDHELVCRENERLIKKIEANNTLPIPMRSSHSGDADLNLDKIKDQETVTLRPNVLDSARIFTKENTLPEVIQKEMDKKRIGTTTLNVIDTLKQRRNGDKIPDDEQHPNKFVDTSILYDIFGSPLNELSRSTSAENILEKEENKWMPRVDCSNKVNDQLHLPRILQKSPSFNTKIFKTTFGSAIPTQ